MVNQKVEQLNFRLTIKRTPAVSFEKGGNVSHGDFSEII